MHIGKLEFVSQNGIEINVSEYSADELTQKAHNFELEKNGVSNVRVDYMVSGIGSASCGPQLLEGYQMNHKNVHFAFSVFMDK